MSNLSTLHQKLISCVVTLQLKVVSGVTGTNLKDLFACYLCRLGLGLLIRIKNLKYELSTF